MENDSSDPVARSTRPRSTISENPASVIASVERGIQETALLIPSNISVAVIWTDRASRTTSKQANLGERNCSIVLWSGAIAGVSSNESDFAARFVFQPLSLSGLPGNNNFAWK